MITALAEVLHAGGLACRGQEVDGPLYPVPLGHVAGKKAQLVSDNRTAERKPAVALVVIVLGRREQLGLGDVERVPAEAFARCGGAAPATGRTL